MGITAVVIAVSGIAVDTAFLVGMEVMAVGSLVGIIAAFRVPGIMVAAFLVGNVIAKVLGGKEWLG